MLRPTEWVAVDLSGHGASCAPPAEPATWDRFHADDVLEVMSECGMLVDGERPVAVGHSMGGAVVVAIELRRPSTFSHVHMIEPPLYTRAGASLVRLASFAGWNMMANAARRRRSSWPSRADAQEHLARRMALGWDERALDAFMASCLRDAADGSVELACSPATEARAYSWPGESLPSLTRGRSHPAVTRSANPPTSFTLCTCVASDFSPIGPLPRVPGLIQHGEGKNEFYYRMVVPHFPGEAGRHRVLGGSATHLVVAEQPQLVAENLLSDLDELERAEAPKSRR